MDAAVTKQLADEQTNVMQLEERLAAHIEATIESRAARWDCWAERQDAIDADRAKMTEEAKHVLKQHTGSLKLRTLGSDGRSCLSSRRRRRNVKQSSNSSVKRWTRWIV